MDVVKPCSSQVYLEQDTDLKSTASPRGPGLKEGGGMQALAETEWSQAYLSRPTLVRGLLGPEGLGVLAHPLFLGLHCSVVPDTGWGGVRPRIGPATTPSPELTPWCGRPLENPAAGRARPVSWGCFL